MSRYQILNDGRNSRNKIGIFDNEEPAKYDGKEITRRPMTIEETCKRLNALEAERDLLRCKVEELNDALITAPVRLDKYILATENDDLRAERDALRALVGTIRDMAGCTVRNVRDISPEQHSHEIGDSIQALEAERDALREALRKTAEYVGGATTPDVSSEFLCRVPEEVRLKVQALTKGGGDE